MKHLVAWLTDLALFRATEVNAQCRSLPPNHHITLFMKGITTLSHVTGKEHKDMCRILIGLIVNLPLPGGQAPLRVVRAVHAILDFMYLAQYPSHTTDTLNCLEASLAQFHDNKDTFIDLGVCYVATERQSERRLLMWGAIRLSNDRHGSSMSHAMASHKVSGHLDMSWLR